MLLRLLLLATAILTASSAATAAWHEAKTKHFIIYGDMDPAEIEAIGERLERFDQAVRKLRGMDDPPLTDAQRLTVYKLKNEEAVGRLLNSDSIIGLYVSGAAGSYAYSPRKAGYIVQRAQLNPEHVLFHEYAHHLQLSTSAMAIPAWLVEGFAEFFGTADVMDDGSVRIGAPPQHREWSVQRNSGLPLEEMLGGTLRNKDFEAVYGRGWLLTHMLSFQPERRGQLQRYVEGIQAGVAAGGAARAAFGDLRSLDNDLSRYLRQKRFNTFVVDGAALAPGPVAVRTLRAGEAAAMDVHMKIRLHPNERDSRRVVADARRIVAKYPNDPFVQLTLAEAELGAKNHAAAEAAGRRSVAADPSSIRAHIAVGRALLEQARINPASADWKMVRDWFLKANKLNPEHAEPLMYFYRSFPMANEPASKNAVDGLMYALVLAPTDSSLRIDAVHQLVLENRLQEARKEFAPIAFYPHSSREWRAKAEPIVDALDRGDRKAALKLFRAEQEKRWSGEDEEH